MFNFQLNHHEVCVLTSFIMIYLPLVLESPNFVGAESCHITSERRWKCSLLILFTDFHVWNYVPVLMISNKIENNF